MYRVMNKANRQLSECCQERLGQDEPPGRIRELARKLNERFPNSDAIVTLEYADAVERLDDIDIHNL